MEKLPPAPPVIYIPPIIMSYLDPKVDMVFKRIFGAHKDLAIDFLNAMLPLDSPIEELEYVTGELTSERDEAKQSIIDVRCRDASGREFLVEMQNRWEAWFMERVLYGCARVYGGQLKAGGHYRDLQPVYSLALLNCVFDRETDAWRHHYRFTEAGREPLDVNFIEAVFVELPKAPKTGNTPLLLWTRFLAEIDEKVAAAPPELEAYPPVNRALDVAAQMALSEAERIEYDRQVDAARLAYSLQVDSEMRDKRIREQEQALQEQQEALQEQQEALQEQGKALQEQNKALEEKDRELEKARSDKKRAAQKMYEQNMPPELIAEALNEEIETVYAWLELDS